MDLKQEIDRYEPQSEQEIKDKEMFLMYFYLFDDVLTRKNEIAHFVTSAIVVNEEKTRALMIHHNIYNSWAWGGGHADGESDLLSVAIREAKEETGILDVKPLMKEICTIDTLPVLGHVKRGNYIPAHIHLSVGYIFEAKENQEICIKPDENSNVAWIDLDKVIEVSTEAHMKPVYEKLIQKIKKMK